MTEAERIIEALGLTPHPEGGWYRETWAAPAPGGGRPLGTAIHFLLREGERSHWHRVDADEIWLWHAGGSLVLSVSETDAGPARVQTLGPEVLASQAPQVVVPAGWWQSGRPVAGSAAGYALVSCVVFPGFRFDGFDLAPEGFDIPET